MPETLAKDGNLRPPSKAELEAARGKTVKDIIRPGLDVLFVGLNPGLYTAAVGHHFGRPGNRFWPTLYLAGFTPRLFQPHEQRALPTPGIGITNLVTRATATAAELPNDDLREGARSPEGRMLRCQ